MFSKKATKIDEIFTNDLTLCSKCQIDGEDFAKFCDLLKGQMISKSFFWPRILPKNKRKHVAY